MSENETTNTETSGKQSEEMGNKREVSTKEAYFTALNEWVKQANISQNAMAMFPWYLMSSYPQLFQHQRQIPQNTPPYMSNNARMLNNNVHATAVNNNNNNNNNNDRLNELRGNRLIILSYRLLGDQAQAAFIQENGGFEYVLAPFWKRAAAEMIDMFILLIMKIIITITIKNMFDLDFGLELNKESLNKIFQENAVSLFAISFEFFIFSTDLLLLEVFTKTIVCLYEAVLTAYCDGATLGKRVLGLRIKHVEAMLPLPRVIIEPVELPGIDFNWRANNVEVRALLFPAQCPGIERSMVRAFAKNIIMTLLFPFCLFLMFFKNNRTGYDIFTKTVVVENNPQPIFRRP